MFGPLAYPRANSVRSLAAGIGRESTGGCPGEAAEQTKIICRRSSAGDTLSSHGVAIVPPTVCNTDLSLG